ncbi:hypothetical protein IAT40_000009 [Kwoniella sp. CBS 6097]
MGTPGAIVFIICGRRRAWTQTRGGNPESLGVDAVRFILSLSEADREHMVEMLDQIKWVTPDEMPSAEEVDYYQAQDYHIPAHIMRSFIEDGDAQALLEERRRASMRRPYGWDSVLVGAEGAACLPPILEGTLRHLVDWSDHYEDYEEGAVEEESDWGDCADCEYSYRIDFQYRTFELRSVRLSGRWTFDQLKDGAGFWMALIQDRIQCEKAREEYKQLSEEERDAIFAQSSATSDRVEAKLVGLTISEKSENLRKVLSHKGDRQDHYKLLDAPKSASS